MPWSGGDNRALVRGAVVSSPRRPSVHATALQQSEGPVVDPAVGRATGHVVLAGRLGREYLAGRGYGSLLLEAVIGLGVRGERLGHRAGLRRTAMARPDWRQPELRRGGATLRGMSPRRRPSPSPDRSGAGHSAGLPRGVFGKDRWTAQLGSFAGLSRAALTLCNVRQLPVYYRCEQPARTGQCALNRLACSGLAQSYVLVTARR
jgi:hypothetical protein